MRWLVEPGLEISLGLQEPQRRWWLRRGHL